MFFQRTHQNGPLLWWEDIQNVLQIRSLFYRRSLCAEWRKLSFKIHFMKYFYRSDPFCLLLLPPSYLFCLCIWLCARNVAVKGRGMEHLPFPFAFRWFRQFLNFTDVFSLKAADGRNSFRIWGSTHEGAVLYASKMVAITGVLIISLKMFWLSFLLSLFK